MVKLLTESDGGLEQTPFGHGCIQIQLITLRSAYEALVDMKLQICGEAAARRCGGTMDRTRPAELVPGSFAGHEADQVQDFSQGDPGPDFGEGDARHGGITRVSGPTTFGETQVGTEKRNP